MKDTHLQEFLDAEAAWKEKTEALQAKVWSTKARFTEFFTFYGVVKNRLCLSNCTERYLDMLCLSYPGHTYAKDAIVRQIGGVWSYHAICNKNWGLGKNIRLLSNNH